MGSTRIKCSGSQLVSLRICFAVFVVKLTVTLAEDLTRSMVQIGIQSERVVAGRVEEDGSARKGSYTTGSVSKCVAQDVVAAQRCSQELVLFFR